MNPLIQLKQTTSVFLVAFGLACFALLPQTQAVSPAPDGGYPGANTAEGSNALLSLTSGINNTAIGSAALLHDTSGSYNVGVGSSALALNTTGSYNMAIGAEALFNSNGSSNLAIGFRVLYNNTTGSSLTGIGAGALQNNTTGFQNTAVGTGALYDNTGGSLNTAIGVAALNNNTTANKNTAVGWQALLRNTTGDGNVAIGYLALSSNTTQGINTSDGTSVAIGFQALQNNTAEDNNAVGHNALQNNTIGLFNNAFGWHALISNVSGDSNAAFGDDAGESVTGNSNSCFGASSGFGITSGNNIIAIGFVSGVSSVAGQVDNSCYISNIIGAGVDPATAAQVFVDQDGKLGTVALSSQRFKKEIRPMGQTSEAVLGLKPVTFQYKYDNKSARQFGLIAEEVAEVNPDLAVRDKNGEVLAVRYDAVTAMLLNEFLKEHRKVEEQEVTITQLKRELQATAARQQKQIEALTAGLQKVSAQLELSKSAPQTVINNR
jgi:hypothetical protein